MLFCRRFSAAKTILWVYARIFSHGCSTSRLESCNLDHDGESRSVDDAGSGRKVIDGKSKIKSNKREEKRENGASCEF